MKSISLFCLNFNMNTLLKKNGITFGIILGILLILPSIIGYFYNIYFLLSNVTFIAVFASVILLGIICISSAKKKLAGKINLKEAFATYFVMLVISLLMSTIFNFVMFNVIDDKFPDKLVEIRVDNLQGQFEAIKNNPETTDENLAKYKKNFNDTISQLRKVNSYSLSSLFKGFTVFLAIFSIFGLLLSMILRTTK